MNWVARKSRGWIIILILLSGCSNSESGNIGQIEKLDSALSIIIDEKAKIKIIAEGFDWCEGPLWLEESKTLLFSDVP